MDFLEKKFAPAMNKINHNIWITTIKDSVMQILPFILLGSVFCVGAILENYVSLPFSFWTPFGWTMGMISILISFLIPLNFCEKKRIRKQRLLAACSGLILFLISVTPETIAEGYIGYVSSTLGAGGMFCAIITGIITSVVFNVFSKFSFFKEDSVIPDFVRQWFDSLLPILVVVFGGFIIVQVLNINLYAIITAAFTPLMDTYNKWYGFILINFIGVFIYSMGISSWCLTPVTTPAMLANTAANLALVAAGNATIANMSIYTTTFTSTTYMYIGGLACTLPLVILMMTVCKSRQLKSLGKACLVPGIFNINEPVVFGAIAWNPIMMIPMWIIGLVVPTLAWIAAKVVGIIPIPQIQFEVWYTPYPICTWIATQGSIAAILFVLALFVLTLVIWFPFVKLYDKQLLGEEANNK